MRLRCVLSPVAEIASVRLHGLTRPRVADVLSLDHPSRVGDGLGREPAVFIEARPPPTPCATVSRAAALRPSPARSSRCPPRPLGLCCSDSERSSPEGRTTCAGCVRTSTGWALEPDSAGRVSGSARFRGRNDGGGCGGGRFPGRTTGPGSGEVCTPCCVLPRWWCPRERCACARPKSLIRQRVSWARRPGW